MTSEIRDDEFSGFYEEETYSKGLDREETIERQTRTAIYFYSRGLWDEFEYAVRGLIALLPKQVRKQFHIPKHNITTEGVDSHYNLFIDIQETIENDTDMIFKKRRVKTYH